jgi:CDP-diacylglycerol---serine O-phosphatidyltransferase
LIGTLFDRLPGREHRDQRRRPRGIFLLPSLFTVGNLFCGYACIVHSMTNELELAAPYIGIAIVLDMLDGRIARLTNTTSAFGVEFDSLADVISFGAAPAILAFSWGLRDLGQIGWAAGFLFVSAAAMRLARFNSQVSAQLDKRYFIGMPTPAAAGVAAATVYAFPVLPELHKTAAAVLLMVVPAGLMVSTIRFRSFKTINFGWGRSYLPLFGFILLIALIATKPKFALLLMAYGYLVSGFMEFGVTRFRSRREPRPPASQ